jgi:hypothetical protein
MEKLVDGEENASDFDLPMAGAKPGQHVELLTWFQAGNALMATPAAPDAAAPRAQ